MVEKTCVQFMKVLLAGHTRGTFSRTCENTSAVTSDIFVQASNLQPKKYTADQNHLDHSPSVMGSDASNTVDDMLKRLHQYSGVVGYVVLNADTIPVKTNLDPALSVQYAGHISQLVSRARVAVKQLETRYVW